LPSERLILGFDTSAAHCAAALVCGPRVLAKRHEDMPRGQAERLFPLLEDLLSEAASGWADLDGIGVGIGTGNFTGIRLSVSAARGLALSLRIPAIGVSSLEMRAHGAERPVLALGDARRGQVYAQLFTRGESHPPELASREVLVERYGGRAGTCIGDDAEEIATLLGARACPAAHDPASAIALIATARFAPDLPRPAPLYLKGADAAPSRDAPPVILP